jgi:hypothetical protein
MLIRSNVYHRSQIFLGLWECSNYHTTILPACITSTTTTTTSPIGKKYNSNNHITMALRKLLNGLEHGDSNLSIHFNSVKNLTSQVVLQKRRGQHFRFLKLAFIFIDVIKRLAGVDNFSTIGR